MDAVDIDVLRACRTWQRAGLEVMLVTVLRTWGSSPRPPGAMMALASDGRVAGSVSGGCIEDDLIDRLRRKGIADLTPDGVPRLERYGVLAEQARRFGLPCGGTLELVLEPLGPQSGLDALLEGLAQRRTLQRTLDLRSGRAWLSDAARDAPPWLDERGLHCVLGASHRLFVIGAGQLSRYLCQTAQGLGFQLTVCDPREEYRAGWDLDGVQVDTGMPDDVLLAMAPDDRTAVLALTHDPKLDDLALIEALRSPAFYVGALGSRANHGRRVDRLRRHFGLTEAELARLRGPAGLYLASRTPPEIALSILAELVAVKNGVGLPRELSVGPAKEAGGLAASAELCEIPPSLV